MNNLRKNWAKMLWVVGLILFLIGESVSAFNAQKDDTASETWRDLPEPARYAVVGILWAVIAHWTWGLPQKIAEKVAEELS